MPSGRSAEDDDLLQTTWHLFSSCDALAALRLQMFGEQYYKPLEEIDRKLILQFIRRAGLHVLPPDNSEVLNIDADNPLRDGEED